LHKEHLSVCTFIIYLFQQEAVTWTTSQPFYCSRFDAPRLLKSCVKFMATQVSALEAAPRCAESMGTLNYKLLGGGREGRAFFLLFPGVSCLVTVVVLCCMPKSQAVVWKQPRCMGMYGQAIAWAYLLLSCVKTLIFAMWEGRAAKLLPETHIAVVRPITLVRAVDCILQTQSQGLMSGWQCSNFESTSLEHALESNPL